eukprot:scaffold63265_cov19-Tisochrysis_lutea.AAC.1
MRSTGINAYTEQAHTLEVNVGSIPAASALVTTCCTNASTPRRWFAIAWLAALARAESRLLDSVLTSVSMTSAYRSWSCSRIKQQNQNESAHNDGQVCP